MVLRQIGRPFGHAVFLQIGRRRAQHHLGHPQLAHDHAGVDLLQAAEEADIDRFLDDVDGAVRQGHVQHHLGIALRVSGQQIADLRLPETGMGIHGQGAGGRLGIERNQGFGIVDLGQDQPHPLQISLPSLGERQAPGRAVEQARAQMRLEVGNEARRHGVGDLHDFRRAHETALLDHLGKYTH